MADNNDTEDGFLPGEYSCTELYPPWTLACVQALQNRIFQDNVVALDSIYQPLSPGETRLVELIQHDNEHIPTCQLRHESVGGGTYTAVSHTWLEEEYCWYGRRLPSKTTLRINGQLVKVKTYVALILSIACFLGMDKIWIDVLCINQKDEFERGHQVANMGRIFKHCREVLIFLGKPSKATDEALRTIPRFGELYLTKSMWPGFLELTGHEYWYRAWILQEIALAPSTRTICGNIVLDDIQTSRLLEALGSAPRTMRESYIQNICRIIGESKGDLLHLLVDTRQAQCSNKLDAIYAKIHMAEIGYIAGSPDYLQAPEELFIHFVKQHVKTSSSLAILHWLDGKRGDGLLPSWVPD